jgi:hypothetical protein
MLSAEDLTVDHDAAPHAGSQNDPEYSFLAACRAKFCLRKSAAVGIVGENYMATENVLQILGQGMTV